MGADVCTFLSGELGTWRPPGAIGRQLSFCTSMTSCAFDLCTLRARSTPPSWHILVSWLRRLRRGIPISTVSILAQALPLAISGAGGGPRRAGRPSRNYGIAGRRTGARGAAKKGRPTPRQPLLPSLQSQPQRAPDIRSGRIHSPGGSAPAGGPGRGRPDGWSWISSGGLAAQPGGWEDWRLHELIQQACG